MVVYADILFFVNFFMNYLIISICSAISPEPTKNRRKLLASALGGIYGVCMFLPDLSFMYSVISVFLFSAGMVAVLFCPCRFLEYLRCLLVFYISSFLLAGSIYMFLPYFGGGIIRNNVIYYDGPKILVIAAVTCFCILKSLKYIKSRFGKNGLYVTVRYKDRTACLKGILDTGNLLCEPICGNPVVVGDEDVLKELFDENCTLLNINEWIESCDIRLIPYQTVGKEGVMTGFLADEIITGKTSTENVVVAISPQKLRHGLLVNNASL